MTVAEKLERVLDDLNYILLHWPNDGDWYGCVRNAKEALAESLRSDPPGKGIRAKSAICEGEKE